MEAFLLTATIEAVVAQRLVRRICLKCKEEYLPTDEQLMEMQLHRTDVEGRTFFRGRGCEACNQLGFRGRTGVFELLVIDDKMRRMVHDGVAEHKVEAHVRPDTPSLREDGLRLVTTGVTSLQELLRVIQ